jgi:hypothetical protein
VTTASTSEGPVGEGLQDVVDLVVEPEGAGELELAFDRGGHRHGLFAGWQQPEHDHPATAGGVRDGGGEAGDAAGGLDGDVGLHRRQRRAVAARRVRVAPSARTRSSGASCRSTTVISPRPARRSTATTSAPMGPAPITSALRPRTSPARPTACHATLAGLGHGGRAQRQPGGQRAQHVRAEGDVVREPALGVRPVRGAAEVGAAGGEVGRSAG